MKDKKWLLGKESGAQVFGVVAWVGTVASIGKFRLSFY
jgi:hypothetical protein